MKTNVGTIDRVIRAVLGVVIMAAAYYLEGAWGLIGLALLLSGYLAYCPVYQVLHVDTCPHKKDGLDQHV
jgi:hypothetical protein